MSAASAALTEARSAEAHRRASASRPYRVGAASAALTEARSAEAPKRPPQPPERREHLGVGEIGVAAAGVRQHEHASAVHDFRLASRRDTPRFQRRRGLPVRTGVINDERNHRPVERDPDERGDLRAIAPDLPVENRPALDILRRAEIVDAGTRPGDEVGDAEPKSGRRSSCSNVIGSGTRPDSKSSFQNRFE